MELTMETLTVNICFASVVLPNKPTTSPRPSDLGSWDVLNKEFTDKLSGDEFLRGELDGRSCAVFDYIEWARNAWISSWFVKNQDLGSNPAEVSSFKVMSSKELQSGVWTCAKLCVFFFHSRSCGLCQLQWSNWRATWTLQLFP